MIGNKQFLFDVLRYSFTTLRRFLKAITSLKKRQRLASASNPKYGLMAIVNVPSPPGSNLPVRQDVDIKNIQFWLVYVPSMKHCASMFQVEVYT